MQLQYSYLICNEPYAATNSPILKKDTKPKSIPQNKPYSNLIIEKKNPLNFYAE